MQLFKRQKSFSEFFLHFLSLDQFSNSSKKKMTLISYALRKLRTPKGVIRQMSKKSRFRRPYNQQHGKASQTLLKSAWQHLYHIYWSMWKKLSWKKSRLVICKMLGLFVNTLAADHKYSLLNCDKLMEPIQMQLFIKQKRFLFFLHIGSWINFWTFWKKKATLIAYVFVKLQAAKDVVGQMSKKSHFRRPFDKQHGRRSQTLLKSAQLNLYQIYWSQWMQLSWKKSPLVIWKIIGLFFNTLTADDKYSVLNCDKLMQLIQIQLSKKQQNFFSSFFLKDQPHSFWIDKSTDSQRHG